MLGALWILAFVAAGWAPHDRQAWLLENLIAAPAVVVLLAMRRRLPFSRSSWIWIFVFLGLHEIGSHYTYSLVPWMSWSQEIFGWTPAWTRNHYDRFVHLAFGLLLTAPCRELLAVPLARHPGLCRALTFCVIATLSTGYELVEWGAAEIVDPELGLGFVGAQGDIWDAQKDTALALGGSLFVICMGAARSRLGLRPLASGAAAGPAPSQGPRTEPPGAPDPEP